MDKYALAHRFSILSAEKKTTFLAKLNEQGISFARLPIVKRSSENQHLLSYAQQRQWFLWQLDPASSAYHISGALRLCGQLNMTALRLSFAAIVARHESLRTTFHATSDGLAEQAVHLEVTPDIPLIDVREHAADSRAVEVERVTQAFISQPFDLSQGPLLRAAVIQSDLNEYVLVVVMHHIISDGWSIPIIMKEFVAYYQAAVNAEPLTLPELPIQYADYAAWQLHWLEAGEKQRQLTYWIAHLGTEHTILQLPTDHPRHAVANYQAARYEMALPAALSLALRQTAQTQGMTLFMLLLAAFQTLLYRYTHQSQIRVGVPVANRHREETTPLIGFFVNTQVLGSTIRPRDTLEDILEQARETALNAQDHQDLPFEQLVEALQPARSLSHNPLFQVMFNHLRDEESGLVSLPDLTVSDYALGDQSAQFEFSLRTAEHADHGVTAYFSYAQELYEASTIVRMGRHYQQILIQLTTDLGCAVVDIPLLDDHEIDQLQQWGNNPQHYQNPLAVHDLIAAQAARTPDAIAVTFEDAHLSYAALDQAANQLAHHLIASGIRPESKVGVALDRSLDMLVALLAVLKAGGVYVPLDSSFPSDRLSYMIDDSHVSLILTQQHLTTVLPHVDGAALLAIDTLDVSAYPLNAPDIVIHPDQLAYAIYTSGSTGKPKGVAVTHHALSHFLHSMQDKPGLQADDRLVAVTSLTFDIAALELYLPLISGAQIILASRDTVRDGVPLVQLMAQHQATVLQSTPSGWRLLLAAGWQGGALKGLCGGEALPPDLAAELRGVGVELWNMYGPTETTIWSAACLVSHDLPFVSGPIAGTQLYILDQELNQTPLGVAGELYIGGVGLARGYLGRAGLTAERFVANPFDAEGGRFYRTGDLVRWRYDGQLEYLSRIDHQVKIRGFRIELGEIEAQLLAQSHVYEAVVVAQQNNAQGARLVAYLSAESGQALDVDGLREALAQALPDYMVPSLIVQLARLPLNANGKIDRNALPEAVEHLEATAFSAPVGEVEIVLAEIWSAVLGIAQIDRHANFFELGGDSIISLQIVARFNSRGWVIKPKQLFEHQTIALLAAVAEPISSIARSEAWFQAENPSVVTSTLADYLPVAAIAALPVVQDEIEDVYPLSPTQAGMLFHSMETPDEGLYINQLSVEVQGLDPERFIAAWQLMIARHSVLRTGFLWQAGLTEPLQVVYRQAELQIVQLDWRGDAGQAEQLQNYVAADLIKPFDFLRAPLSRMSLIRLDEQRYQLVWTQHHVLLDGWSTAQLIGELLQQYDRLPLPPIAPNYGHYVRWLAQQDPAVDEVFWTQALQQIEGTTLLADATRQVQSWAGDRAGYAKIYTQWGISQTTDLRNYAKQQRVTLNTVIQAAWALLLHRYTRKETVVFGATVAGRPTSLAGVEDMLGLFLNTIPVPVQYQSQQSVGEYLRTIQQTNLALREHEHTPLADIQRWAGSAGRSLFDSIIVFENYPINKALQASVGQSLQFGEVASEGLTGYAMDLQVIIDEELSIEYCYATDQLSDVLVLQLRRQMESVLIQMIAQPNQPLSELTWLDPEETNHVLAWGQKSLGFEWQHVAGHHLVETQVGVRPNAIALRQDQQTLSFEDLNQRANQLAHYLISLGVGLESRVGVALRRSPEVIVTLLAILKANAAYVPLDPDYPVDRLQYMMRDSGMRYLISQDAVITQLSLPPEIELLNLDYFAWDAWPTHNPALPYSPDQLAYIIYTSGSTGTPKGVAVSHGPWVMHCQATAEIYAMQAESCELLFMSFAFDGAHERWLTALSIGASVAVRDHELWTAEQAYEALHRYQVNAVAFPPAYLNQIAEWGASRQDPPPVELYVFGGEAMPKASYERIQHTLKPKWLLNGYGPTETVVTPLIWKTDVAGSFDCDYAPIGRPVGARTAYVLNDDLQLVPIGAVGELYIGGYGLARGYLGQPGLTAERFLADPFDTQGGRIYRTGDLVRWLGDGNIEYIGRVDHQVKIRGFRIELGEIEARIREHTAILETVISVYEGGAGRQLVAYVVPVQEGLTVAAQRDLAVQLKQRLAAVLPDYMVPSSIEVLARMPLLPNGKLNRAALPAPENNSDHSSDYVAPRNALEQGLAEIWQQVLRVEKIGIRDNFFELGGDSILSLQVISKVKNSSLHVEIRLRDLMRYQTIEGLVEHIGLQSPQPVETKVTHALAEGRVALTPIQAGFLTEEVSEPHHFNQSVLLKTTASLDPIILQQSLQYLSRQHDALRMRFIQRRGRWLQEYASAEADAQSEVLWLRRAIDSDQLAQICDAAQRSLHLTQGPIWRVVQIAMADGSARLLVIIHHLLVDGVSWRILLEDFQRVYLALQAGQVPSLPVKTNSFRAWSDHLQALAGSAQILAELPYWQKQLVDVPEMLCDDPDALNQVGDATAQSFQLSASLTEQLLRVALIAYRTGIEDILLTALARTYQRINQHDALLINLEGHGRETGETDIDLSRTVAWFTAAYPVRLHVQSRDVGENIIAIKAQLGSVPHKGLGYGVLRYLAAPDIQASVPVNTAHITFSYLGQFESVFDERGLFTLADGSEKVGLESAESTPLMSGLEITGRIYQGSLSMAWRYSHKRYDAQTIENMMEIYQDELIQLIGHCVNIAQKHDEVQSLLNSNPQRVKEPS